MATETLCDRCYKPLVYDYADSSREFGLKFRQTFFTLALSRFGVDVCLACIVTLIQEKLGSQSGQPKPVTPAERSVPTVRETLARHGLSDRVPATRDEIDRVAPSASLPESGEGAQVHGRSNPQPVTPAPRMCKHCKRSADDLGPVGMWQHCPEHEGGALLHEFPEPPEASTPDQYVCSKWDGDDSCTRCGQPRSAHKEEV